MARRAQPIRGHDARRPHDDDLVIARLLGRTADERAPSGHEKHRLVGVGHNALLSDRRVLELVAAGLERVFRPAVRGAETHATAATSEFPG